MSKRAGTVVTLEDLVDAVGVDAARYSLVRASVDTTLDLDLDLDVGVSAEVGAGRGRWSWCGHRVASHDR